MQESRDYSRIQTTVVIPVYNQERDISIAIAKVKDILDSSGLSDYEIIAVNDGSTDDTLEVLNKEKNIDQRIKVTSYTPNRGKGYAVKKGVMQSHGNVVMFLDGDLNISPLVIREYLGIIAKSNLIIASKRHPNSIVSIPPSRKFFSRAFNLLVQASTGLHVHDTQAGLKVGDGETMRRIFHAVSVNRYAFDVELLAVASVLKLNIREMPVHLTINRRFKVRDIARMFLDVMAVTYKYRIAHAYQKELAKTSFEEQTLLIEHPLRVEA